jgi:hypothetical protein
MSLHLIFIILSALMNLMNRKLLLLLIVILLVAGVSEAKQKGARKRVHKQK